MNKILSKLALISALVSTSLMAELSHNNDTYSLIGLEGGYSVQRMETDASPAVKEDLSYNHIGIKIGSQSKNYRLFLSVKNHDISAYDGYLLTYGAEFQYLLNVSSFMNFYVGMNTGKGKLRFEDKSGLTREISRYYFGGDAGMNLHIGDSFDFEVGTRTIDLRNFDDTQNNITYTFDSMISGYASIIYKYQID